MFLVLNTMLIKDCSKPADFVSEVMWLLSLAMVNDTQFKIFRAIVSFVPILMVNHLAFQKWPAEHSSHNKAMLKHSWRAAVLLAHSLTKGLIFWRKPRKNKGNVALAGCGSFVSLFVARVSRWWNAVAASAKASEDLFVPDSRQQSVASHPSWIAALPAHYLKDNRFLVENGVNVPMDSASVDKANIFGLDTGCDWFSHVIIPHFIMFHIWNYSRKFQNVKDGVIWP